MAETADDNGDTRRDYAARRVRTQPLRGNMPAMSTDRGRHAVFLDRDGVLNRAVIRGGRPFPPRTTQDLEIPEDAAASLQALRRAGYALVAVTNQPDVARGTQRREDVEAINREIQRRLPLDDFRVCYHDNADGCECRKPKPGMILDSARQPGPGSCQERDDR